MLRIGHHFCWKILYLIHSKRTIRKYESHLGIKVREVFDETGPCTYRSHGYQLIQTLTNFWKSISGKRTTPKRREVTR